MALLNADKDETKERLLKAGFLLQGREGMSSEGRLTKR